MWLPWFLLQSVYTGINSCRNFGLGVEINFFLLCTLFNFKTLLGLSNGSSLGGCGWGDRTLGGGGGTSLPLTPLLYETLHVYVYYVNTQLDSSLLQLVGQALCCQNCIVQAYNSAAQGFS